MHVPARVAGSADKMSNGSDLKILTIINSLIVAAVVGTVGLAVAQSALEQKVDHNTKTLAERREAVEAVPIIKRDLEHIKDKIDTNQKRNEAQNTQILEAIKELKPKR